MSHAVESVHRFKLCKLNNGGATVLVDTFLILFIVPDLSLRQNTWYYYILLKKKKKKERR